MKSLFETFFSAWRTQFITQISTVFVLTGSFMAIVVSLVVISNLDQLITSLAYNSKIVVYLEDNLNQSEKNTIENLLKKQKQINKIKFTSKAQALTNLRKDMSSIDSEVETYISKDFSLPESFEASLVKTISLKKHKSIMSDLSKTFKSTKGVADVSLGESWIGYFSKLLKSFSVASASVLILLVVGSGLIIGNVIKISIFQRRKRIEILELIGATRSDIQLPYVVEGSLLGALSSIVALFCSFALYEWQSQSFFKTLSLESIGLQLGFISILECLIVVSLGLVIGGLSSFVVVRRLNSGWLASEN